MGCPRPSVRARASAPVLLSLLLTLAPGAVLPALAAKGDCGQPSSTGSTPKSSDALLALKSAVGSVDCDLCVCDVTNDSKITASDALRILKKAVGQSVTLTCPACVPTLRGTVMAPSSMIPASLLADGTQDAAVPGGDAANVNVELPIAGLVGLAPVGGATVELFNLDSEGNPQLPAVSWTTTKPDGSFKFQPAPTASSTAMVRATVGSDTMRAFVSDSATLRVDPASEFVVAAAVDAVKADGGAGLSDLSVVEAGALVRLVRQSEIDVGGMSSMADTLALLEDRTGGIRSQYVAGLATSTGASPSVAGNFHLVNLVGVFTRMFTPSTSDTPSVNERWVHTYNTADPVVVDGSGVLTQALASGRSHTLKEISGRAQQQSGPDVAINATASLESADVSQTPGTAAGTLLVSDSGQALLQNASMVGAGALASGSDFGLVEGAARITTGQATGGASFLLRQGSGMTKSSLNGTYWMIHLEFDLEASTGGNTVQRAVGARVVTHTGTFDGSGNLSIGAADDVNGRVQETSPTPDQAPADTLVQLQVAEETAPAASGLTYTVDSNGKLTVKEGDVLAGVGALSADGRILLLRVGEDDGGFADSGLILGLKRGSGMNNASASGTYRSTEFQVELEAQLTPGQVDVNPSNNYRSVGLESGLGTIVMDGAGHVDVSRTVQSNVALRKVSGVMQTSTDPDRVLDADVQVTGFTNGEGDGTENHSFTVASNGKVTIDGGATGYLSSDGKVFVLPLSEADSTRARAGLLIALREP